MKLLEATRTLDRLNDKIRETFGSKDAVYHSFIWGSETFTLGVTYIGRKGEDGLYTDAPCLHIRTDNDVTPTMAYTMDGDFFMADMERASVWLKNFVELHNSINVPLTEESYQQ